MNYITNGGEDTSSTFPGQQMSIARIYSVETREMKLSGTLCPLSAVKQRRIFAVLLLM